MITPITKTNKIPYVFALLLFFYSIILEGNSEYYGSSDKEFVPVNPLPTINTQPKDVALCKDEAAVFLVDATANGPATLSYQWQKSINGSWTALAEETMSSLTILGAQYSDNGSEYRCIITAVDTNGVSSFINSNTVKLMVHSPAPIVCNTRVVAKLDQTCSVPNVVDLFLKNTPNDGIFYEVKIRNASGKIIPDTELSNYKGQTLSVSIQDICDGNLCWGAMKVEDKLSPTIDCGPDMDIYCYDVDEFKNQTIDNATFLPTWTDNCGAITASFVTNSFLTGCAGGSIKRTWTVTDESGNTTECDQSFNIITKLPWRCPTGFMEVSCEQDISPEALSTELGISAGFPSFQDNNIDISILGKCSYYVAYSDAETNSCGANCNGNRNITRTWTILDWCNNESSTCFQLIKTVDNTAPTFIVKDTIASTAPWYCEGDFFVPNPVALYDNCDANPTWTIKSETPDISIVPALLNGGPHPIYKYRVIGAPRGESFFTYTATDCCGNETSLTSKITIIDKRPPVIVAKSHVIVSLPPQYDSGPEAGYATLYALSVDNGSYDNCSNLRVEIRRPAGSPACKNFGNGDPKTNNNETFSNLLPPDTDNNMPYNENDTDKGEFVKFCCEDLVTQNVDGNRDGVINHKDVGYNEVILRVWDDGNEDGIIGNVGDNWSEASVYVKVENKIPPILTCPADTIVRCDKPIISFESNTGTLSIDSLHSPLTGLPEVFSTCSNPDISFKDKLNINHCGIGNIERTFVAIEGEAFGTCIQNITVIESDSTKEWITSFPSDWEDVVIVSCTGPSEEQIRIHGPINTTSPCEVIGINKTISQFYFEDGSCRKWTVEYNYANWCDEEVRGPFFKYFKYNDEIAPVFTTCADTILKVNANCEINGYSLTKTAADPGGCSDNNWLKWTVIVDLWADGIDDIEYTSFVPVNNDVSKMINGNFTAITDDNGNGIPDVYLAPTASGVAIAAGKIILPTIAYQLSSHKVSWSVTDGCNNFVTCQESLMIVDKKAPTPICVPKITVLLQDPDGTGPALPMVELQACDFMDKAYDNCTASEDLLYTYDNVPMQIENIKIQGRDVNAGVAHYFNADGGKAAYPARDNNSVEKAIRDAYLRGEDGLQLWNPVTRCAAKIWTYMSFMAGQDYTKVDVKVTVWDERLNYDYCWSVLDPGIICAYPVPDEGFKGNISNEEGKAVKDVEVILEGNLPEFPKTTLTDQNGDYITHEVYLSLRYLITATKNDDCLNGLNTEDLILLQNHLVGTQPLNSPYKLIAADVNNDGEITYSDFIELRKLILGTINDFPNNQSWRFPIEGQFTEGVDPFPFIDSYDTLKSEFTTINLNFIGVKIGDLNGSVVTDDTKIQSNSRITSNLNFYTKEQFVEAESIVEIPITSANFKDVFGYQFTINLEGASFVDVQAGAIEVNANNIGVISNGVVTMSFSPNEGITVNENEVLFTLILKTNKAGKISEMIDINSNITKAESYVGTDLSVGNVSLNVRTAPVADATIALFQNEPNPFKGQTTVSFEMPSAAAATISIYDVTGKLVKVRKVDANKGMNSEIFTTSELGATGVLYYTLESGDFTATKTMIIVE